MSACLGCACCGRLILVERQLEDTQKDLELCRKQGEIRAAAEQMERAKELNGLRQELSATEARVKGKEALIEQLKAGLKEKDVAKKREGGEKLEKLENDNTSLKQKMKALQSEKEKLDRANETAVKKLEEMQAFLKQLIELKAKCRKLEKENTLLRQAKGIVRPNGTTTPHVNGVTVSATIASSSTSSAKTTPSSATTTTVKPSTRSVSAKKTAAAVATPAPAPVPTPASLPSIKVPVVQSSAPSPSDKTSIDNDDDDDLVADLGDALDSDTGSEHSSPIKHSLSTPPLPTFAVPAPRSPASSRLHSTPPMPSSPASSSPIPRSTISRYSALSPRKPLLISPRKSFIVPSVTTHLPISSPPLSERLNGPPLIFPDVPHQTTPPLPSIPISPTLSESGDVLSQLSQMSHSSFAISPLQGDTLPPVVHEPPDFTLPPSITALKHATPIPKDEQFIVPTSQSHERPFLSSSSFTITSSFATTTADTHLSSSTAQTQAADTLTSLASFTPMHISTTPSSSTSSSFSSVVSSRPVSPTHSAALSLTELSQSPRISSPRTPLVVPSTTIVPSTPTLSEAGLLSQLQQLSHVSVAISPLGPTPTLKATVEPPAIKLLSHPSKRPPSTRVAPNVNGARRKSADSKLLTPAIILSSAQASSSSTLSSETKETQATNVTAMSIPRKDSESSMLDSEQPALSPAQKPKRRHGSLEVSNGSVTPDLHPTPSKQPRATKPKPTPSQTPTTSLLPSSPEPSPSSELPRARPTYPPNFLAPFQLEESPPFVATSSDHSEFLAGVKKSFQLLHADDHLVERLSFILSSLEKTSLSSSVLPAPLCFAIITDVLQSVVTSKLTQEEAIHAYAVLICRLSNFLSKHPGPSSSSSLVLSQDTSLSLPSSSFSSSSSSSSDIKLIEETLASISADNQLPSFCRVINHDSLIDLFISCVVSVLIQCNESEHHHKSKLKKDGEGTFKYTPSSSSSSSSYASSSLATSPSLVAASSVACAIALSSVLGDLHTRGVHYNENGFSSSSSLTDSCSPPTSLLSHITRSLDQGAQSSLVKLVAFTCLQQGRLHRLRAFCTELFLSCPLLPVENVAAVVQVWPEVFTAQHDSLLSQALRTTFLLSYQERASHLKGLTSIKQINLDSSSWDEVFHIVSQNPPVSISYLAEKCINILATDAGYFSVVPSNSASSSSSGEFAESVTALQLLAVTQGFLWTYNVLIRDLLWQKLCSCRNFDLLPGLLAGLGVLASTGLPYLASTSLPAEVLTAVTEALCTVRDLLLSFLTTEFPLSVQLSAALSICGTIDQLSLQNYEPITGWFRKLNKDEKAQLRASRHRAPTQNFMFMEKALADLSVS